MMDIMPNSDACFDVLVIVNELDFSLNRVSRLEIQRIAYLACLLALYEGHPVADWNYKFARTEFGTPFSAEINNALSYHVDNGNLIREDGWFNITDSGQEFLNILLSMSNLQERRPFLSAACGSLLLVPPGIFHESLDNEPTVRRALQRETGGALLEGTSLEFLYEQFNALATVVPKQNDDLLTPSVVWLNYMANSTVSRNENMGDVDA